LAALMAGAGSADVTVNGLGERAGNATLDEVVMALKLTARKDLGIDTHQFRVLSEYVARAAARPLPTNKPVTGRDAFRHETGIHVSGLLADPRTYEPFSSQEVGGPQSEILVGKHSGRAAIRHVLARSGIFITAVEATRLLPAVRSAAAERKSVLPPPARAEICRRQRATEPVPADERSEVPALPEQN